MPQARRVWHAAETSPFGASSVAKMSKAYDQRLAQLLRKLRVQRIHWQCHQNGNTHDG